MSAVIKKGMLHIVTEDEYSDYSILAVIRALDDLPIERIKQLKQIFFSEVREQHQFKPGNEVFIDWLAERGLVERVGYSELWLGRYGAFCPEVEGEE